jgi:hypothetical protein
MSYPITPGFSSLGILAPMDPTTMTNPIHQNSWIGPLVTSDWSSPVQTIGPSRIVSRPDLGGFQDAMQAFDVVNFLFPV